MTEAETSRNLTKDVEELQGLLQWERQQRQEMEQQLQVEKKKNQQLMDKVHNLERSQAREQLDSFTDVTGTSPPRSLPLSITGSGGRGSRGGRSGRDRHEKFEVSRNVLVIDDCGTKLQPLRDLLVRIYGYGFQDPFQGEYMESDDDGEIVSFGTATDLLNRFPAPNYTGIGTFGNSPFGNASSLGSYGSSNNPMTQQSFSTLEMAMNPSTSAAQSIIDILNRQWIAYQDESFQQLTEVAEYGDLLLKMCMQARELVNRDSIFLEIESPIYIMGDIHGSFRDLKFFLDRLVNFGHMAYTASKLLFLGDYVDRGDASLEVAALVLAMKCVAPESVYLLRGNHETAECNANTRTYGTASFISQCIRRLGHKVGFQVHAAFNEVFSQMPLVAAVDRSVFCVHGGIPKPAAGESFTDCLQRLKNAAFPRFENVTPQESDPPHIKICKQTAMGILWSDPAPADTELDDDGWGENPQRGDEIYAWGKPALDNFLQETGYQYIIRAHEVKQQGLRLCQSGKVITVFTSSAYCGGDNAAGAIYIANKKLRMLSCMTNIHKPMPVTMLAPGGEPMSQDNA